MPHCALQNSVNCILFCEFVMYSIVSHYILWYHKGSSVEKQLLHCRGIISISILTMCFFQTSSLERENLLSVRGKKKTGGRRRKKKGVGEAMKLKYNKKCDEYFNGIKDSASRCPPQCTSVVKKSTQKERLPELSRDPFLGASFDSHYRLECLAAENQFFHLYYVLAVRNHIEIYSAFYIYIW